MKAILSLILLLTLTTSLKLSAKTLNIDAYKGCTVKLSLAYSYGQDQLVKALNDSGYVVKRFKKRDSKENRPFFEIQTDHVKKHYGSSYITLSFRASVEYPVYNWRHPHYRFSILPGGDMMSQVFNRRDTSRNEQGKIAFNLLKRAISDMPVCNKELVDEYKRIEANGGYH